MSNLSPFEFALRQATRTSVKPLICLYSPSGCGKTYSALLLARGMVGDAGKIGLADSEAGRGSLYADIIPGGYQTLAINEPFSPRKYLECMMFMERQKLDIGIIDSGSHEWEGLGGVLEMAHEREVKSGKTGLHVWKEPKMEHQKWVQHFLQSPIPWIICLRAKHKSRQTKNAQGKTEIVRDDDASPIQAEDFIFEMTAHMEILPNHAIKLTKCSHPDLRRCFPKDNTEPLTIETGVATNGVGLSANYTVDNTILAANGQTPFAPGITTQTVNLVLPSSLFGPRVNSIDMRFGKILRFGGHYRANIAMDLYNLLNSNVGTAFNQGFGTNGATWMRPTAVLNPRFARFNVTFDF